MGFADRLKKLRKEKNLTQDQLANIMGMSRGTIAMYEIGKRDPDTSTVGKIASLFNVSTDYILGLSNDSTPKKDNENFPNDIKIMMRDATNLNDEQKEIIRNLIKQFTGK